ncbi:T4 family baseplate hub assembly chaperone [Duganella vulcania]|uniref:Phage baseplate protein n=1 Tax=Duganella vulcania TaxID=2692166 RepID=A0A845GYU2_9BURK|nr:hypothetical protein [Duganella vulcania]MYM98428.1 hypothetical protein [Duganella vulcania]
MRTPGTAELLDIWDVGQPLPPARRALLLLSAAYPERDDIASWPLGYINRQLIVLRQRLFGYALVCLADCPACEEVVEIEMPMDALLNANEMADATHRIHSEGCDVRFHLPTAHDLLLETNGTAPGRLLARTIDSASRDGVDVAPAELGEATLAAVEQAIERADPLAHIAFAMSCPACGHEWSTDLHIIDVLWAEIGACVRRVLSEVGRLAQAFGWRESDILAMSSTRRNHYLEWLET